MNKRQTRANHEIDSLKRTFDKRMKATVINHAKPSSSIRFQAKNPSKADGQSNLSKQATKKQVIRAETQALYSKNALVMEHKGAFTQRHYRLLIVPFSESPHNHNNSTTPSHLARNAPAPPSHSRIAAAPASGRVSGLRGPVPFFTIGSTAAPRPR
jgi:hypothetical protein